MTFTVTSQTLNYFGVGGNLNLDILDNDDDHFLQASPSLYLSATLSARMNIYIETFGVFPISSDARGQGFVDGGLWYLLSDSLQLDLTIGSGMRETRDGLFSSVGFSIAF